MIDFQNYPVIPSPNVSSTRNAGRNIPYEAVLGMGIPSFQKPRDPVLVF